MHTYHLIDQPAQGVLMAGRRRLGQVLLALTASAGLLTGCTSTSAPTKTTAARSASNQPAPASSASATGLAANWVQQENQRPGSADWRIDKGAPDAELTGYATQVSIAPGDAVQLRVRCSTPSWSATAFRLGYYAGTGARKVWTSTSQPTAKQPAPQTLAGHMVSAANWKTNLTVTTTGWVPGSYVFKLTDSWGRSHYIPLTVRTPDNAGRLVLLAATTTYQAYNTWGGYSLYKGPTASDPRATHVSYDRPYDQNGARYAVGYEYSIVREAERLGLNLGFTTSWDLEARPNTLSGAAGIVSPGHDEYWSVPMRAAVEALRDKGTNLAFLGANAVYWRIRFENSGRTIVTYKFDAQTADPVQGPTNTGLWRWYQPESGLTGQMYECFPAHGAFVVYDPSSFLLAGTGAKKGSSYPGLVGVEIDRAYPSSPASTQVIGHSPVQCSTIGPTYSDFTYYTTPSGAGVVDVGSMDWRVGIAAAGTTPKGLTADSARFATKVTDNLLTAMAAGPMGKTHNSVANLSAVKPNPSPTTGTGGLNTPD